MLTRNRRRAITSRSNSRESAEKGAEKPVADEKKRDPNKDEPVEIFRSRKRKFNEISQEDEEESANQSKKKLLRLNQAEPGGEALFSKSINVTSETRRNAN
jgi:hypothetical protein